MEKVAYQRTHAGLVALRGSEVLATIPADETFALFLSIAADGCGDIHKHGAAADVKSIYESTNRAHATLRLKMENLYYYEIPVADLNDAMVEAINQAINSSQRLFLV